MVTTLPIRLHFSSRDRCAWCWQSELSAWRARAKHLLPLSSSEANSSSELHCTNHTRTKGSVSGEVELPDPRHFLYGSQSMQIKISVSTHKVAHGRTMCPVVLHPAATFALVLLLHLPGQVLPRGSTMLPLCLVCPLPSF